MIRTLTCLALAAAVLFAWPQQAEAAESYDNCTGFIDSLPATISTQGTWCLRKDLGTAMTSGNAITVAANNVTLACNDFKIGGLAAGAGSQAYNGAAIADIEANTVAGVFASTTHASAYGIQASAGGSAVRGNQVRDVISSGSGAAYGISSSSFGRLIIRDNDLHGNGASGSIGVNCSPGGLATARDNVINNFQTAISNCQSAYNTVNAPL